MIYLIVLILLLFLSFRYDINGKTEGRDQCYMVMLVVFILVAGLRFRVTGDTIAYLYNFYHVIPKLDNLDFTRLDTFRFEPLWVLLNSVVKSLGGKFYIVQLIQAAIVNVLVFKYIKKHSEFPFLCVTMFYILDYRYFCMMIMRNAVAIVICLFANDYVLEKRWKKAISLFFIAFLFHYSTLLVIVITPFILWLRLNKTGIIVLLSMLLVGVILRSYIEGLTALIAINDVVSRKLDGYVNNGFLSTEDNNVNYFIYAVLLPFIYTIASLFYVKKYQLRSNLLKFEPFLMVGLMLVLLRMNIGMLHRFTKLYELYFIMFYAQSLMIMYKRKGILMRSVSLARSLLVFFPFFFISLVVESKRYHYSTIIEMRIDKELEKSYMNRSNPVLPSPNKY